MFRRFMAFVDAVLLRCTATEVKSFLFDAPFHAFFPRSRTDRWLRNAVEPTIDRWLHFAVEHNIEEVSMTLYNDNTYDLPQFFFLLHYAELKDDAMTRVLSGCPVLEFFELNGCSGLKHIKVKSRGLKELVIDSHGFRSGQGCFLKVSAPHLLKLHLLGNSSVGGEFKADKVSSLVETELNFEETLGQVQAHGDLVKTLL